MPKNKPTIPLVHPKRLSQSGRSSQRQSERRGRRSKSDDRDRGHNSRRGDQGSHQTRTHRPAKKKKRGGRKRRAKYTQRNRPSARDSRYELTKPDRGNQAPSPGTNTPAGGSRGPPKAWSNPGWPLVSNRAPRSLTAGGHPTAKRGARSFVTASGGSTGNTGGCKRQGGDLQPPLPVRPTPRKKQRTATSEHMETDNGTPEVRMGSTHPAVSDGSRQSPSANQEETNHMGSPQTNMPENGVTSLFQWRRAPHRGAPLRTPCYRCIVWGVALGGTGA